MESQARKQKQSQWFWRHPGTPGPRPPPPHEGGCDYNMSRWEKANTAWRAWCVSGYREPLQHDEFVGTRARGLRSCPTPAELGIWTGIDVHGIHAPKHPFVTAALFVGNLPRYFLQISKAMIGLSDFEGSYSEQVDQAFFTWPGGIHVDRSAPGGIDPDLPPGWSRESPGSAQPKERTREGRSEGSRRGAQGGIGERRAGPATGAKLTRPEPASGRAPTGGMGR